MIKWIKNNSGITKTWLGQQINNQAYYQIQSIEEIAWANDSELLTDIANGNAIVAKDDSGSNNITNVNDAINYLKDNLPKEVSLSEVAIEANRLQSMDNRVPNGYSLYICGESDDIINGVYGNGDLLQFDSSNKTRYFQLLNHYYAIGARATWKNCDLSNYFNATLVAPATTGLTNVTGDFDKVNLGGSLNLIKPVTAGTGAWNMSLVAKLTNTNILKATPVPVPGNNGWFDYNSSTNLLTPNMNQTGGYNLYDFEVNLHAFGRKVWGTPEQGGRSDLDVTGLIGKLLFNSWKIKINFDISGGVLSSEKACVSFIVATKQNI